MKCFRALRINQADPTCQASLPITYLINMMWKNKSILLIISSFHPQRQIIMLFKDACDLLKV